MNRKKRVKLGKECLVFPHGGLELHGSQERTYQLMVPVIMHVCFTSGKDDYACQSTTGSRPEGTACRFDVVSALPHTTDRNHTFI